LCMSIFLFYFAPINDKPDQKAISLSHRALSMHF
jgi:hypothetical protein